MQIKAKDGANLTKRLRYLRKCNSFYSDLYTTKNIKITEDREDLIFVYEHPQKLKEIDKEKLEGLVTEKGCLETVKSMESGESPGTDGLSVGFLKDFWKDVSSFLIGSLNRS